MNPRSGFEYGQGQNEKPAWLQQGETQRGFNPEPVSATPPQQSTYSDEPMERRSQWSLGDLLARASEDDEPELYSDRNDSYGAPPIAAPVGHRGNANGGLGQSSDNRIDFQMADIAACIDERRVMEICSGLKRGETSVLQERGIYPRQGQATVDRVRRRFDTDETFRIIVQRYLVDFEKMLQDLSKTDPRGLSRPAEARV